MIDPHLKNFGMEGYLAHFCSSVDSRVESEWLSCKNLQVSGRNLQGDASPCKFFFQKLARSYKITIRLASSYKLTIRLASSYKLTIRLASSYKLTIRLASSYKLTIRLASSYKLTIRLTRSYKITIRLASSYKLTIRLASSYKLTIRLASSYKLTIRLASSYKLTIFCKKLASSYKITIRPRPGLSHIFPLSLFSWSSSFSGSYESRYGCQFLEVQPRLVSNKFT